VIDWDQPQGEGNKPKYEKYPMDIPQEWDGEEANIQEWDDKYNDEIQTEYCINMILISDEYHS
jgi:hypothetical protein